MAEFIYQMIKARKAIGDKVILDDVTMSFFPGAKIGMVGPNGAGKSSILKIMAGLHEDADGVTGGQTCLAIAGLIQAGHDLQDRGLTGTGRNPHAGAGPR